MNILKQVLSFLFIIQGIGLAAQSQFVARYLPVGNAGTARLLASDNEGNFFAVATVQEISGRPQIRAMKTDSQGNVTASFDFGGSVFDVPSGAAIDPDGNLVIVGTAYSPDFPFAPPAISNTSFPFQISFIMKLDSQLTRILFSIPLGGTHGGTSANAVAVDGMGNIYVTGSTHDPDFPVTSGAFQTNPPGYSAFVTELAGSGNGVVYSTYFGSNSTICSGGSACVGVSGTTKATAIAVDADGAVRIAGITTANQVPVHNPGNFGLACECDYNTFTGFLATFAPGGAQLEWAAYLPLMAAPSESVASITTAALDASGDVLISGTTADGFPVSTGALQPSYPEGAAFTAFPSAGFIAKFSSSGLVFSTYFGGNIDSSQVKGVMNGVTALALDAQGNIWVTGGSVLGALPFPVSVPLLGPTYVAELSADGTTLLSGITAPGGAAGQSIVVSPTGTVASLGSSGSILLNLASDPAAFLGIGNSAATVVSGEVAPAELVSLFGVGIGPANALAGQVVNGAYTNSLAGVQVFFGSTVAPLLYAGPNQINAIVPSDVLGQNSITLKIVTPQGPVIVPSIAITPSQPEVFLSPPSTQNLTASNSLAKALNQDGTVNSASAPAAAGSVMTIWATGAGTSLCNGPDGSIAGTTLYMIGPSVSVLASQNLASTIFDSLEVLYAGSAPGLATSVFQVNFRLPQEVVPGPDLVMCELQVGSSVSDPFFVYVQNGS